LKMFHALALNVSREPAVTLAYRYGRIREGMRGRGDEAVMTAVVSDEAMRGIPRFENRETSTPDSENRAVWGPRAWGTQVASGIAMLRANHVEVRGVEEMAEIAAAVRREIGE